MNTTEIITPAILLTRMMSSAYATTKSLFPDDTYRLVVGSGPKDISLMSGITKVKNAGETGKPYIMLNLICSVTDADSRRVETLAEEMGVNPSDLEYRYSIYIECDSTFTPLQGAGKNMELGRLLEAVGQNNRPEWTWLQLAGAMFDASIVQSVDRRDGVTLENKVKAVKASS